MGRDIGRTFRDFDVNMLGEVEEAIITPDDTVLKFKDISSTGINLKDDRDVRVEEITAIMDNISEESDIEQYKRRISNLVSGISVIQVGGNSEVEIKDKKLRIEDAINSVKAAMEEGIVPGGGYSFLSAVINAPDRKGTLGENIVYKSLEAVTRQIAENAGFDGPMTVAECYNKHLGFNALTGEYEDLVETGVINAAKVDRYGIINAASIASTVITMGGLIIEENEPESNVLQLSGPIPGMM
jgi:chaperonin GroEL